MHAKINELSFLDIYTIVEKIRVFSSDHFAGTVFPVCLKVFFPCLLRLRNVFQPVHNY